METLENTMVTVSTTIEAPVEKVWRLYTHPKHIVKWNYASDDWHTPLAENDLRVGGWFLSRMESKDGKEGFDFTGIYTKVEKYKLIEYMIEDGREVKVTFRETGDETTVTVKFETEHIHTAKQQQEGWQAILDNFCRYVEGLCRMLPLHFEITINARVDKVYEMMLSEKGFSDWTAEFNPTSRWEGSWAKGSKMLFLGEDRDGSIGGMVARIRENIPNRFVSIEYMGIVKDGEEIMSGKEVDAWAGGLENYSFAEVNRKTIVSVDTETNHEFKTYFMETWPRALARLKAICEKKSKH